MFGNSNIFFYLCPSITIARDMGIYINKGNVAFRRIRNSEYVDKSGLIAVVNRTLFTERSFTCVTRCRRFGKSMAAKMLAAYYDHSCDSRQLFADLAIANDPTFEEHLNKYPVIYLDMTDFTGSVSNDNIVQLIEQELLTDISKAFPDIAAKEDDTLMKYLLRVVDHTNVPFIFIIDEWDTICRENQPGSRAMDEYVGWLRRMFKSVQAVTAFAGVYMTGILPIKKFRTESAMNNFQEYSMVSPGEMASFFGFTREEVQALAVKHEMDFYELEKWYDGYQIGQQPSMFNPNSVMQALGKHWCESYWGKTGAADAVADYISRNFDGLKDDILSMLAGERCHVEPIGFRNDLSEINTRDDVLTVLIHLGYLAYDRRTKDCYVPNLEVSDELKNAVRETGWTEVAKALEQSRQLLDATLRCDARLVAHMVQEAHIVNASIIKYSDENSMSCVLAIAYYYAHGDYIFHREYQTGTGFADLVMIPRKNVCKPAIIVELKYNDTAGTAIDQIHQRQYPQKVAEYTGDILLVAVSYDRKTKEHQCQIETWQK